MENEQLILKALNEILDLMKKQLNLLDSIHSLLNQANGQYLKEIEVAREG
jgi:hypothetical protein